ncbi:MAG: aldose 1-epimerase family protein [Lentisphaerae bacterium]|nr:aldose 1-epimerase family protein [Lentisphaerota bacterium]
MTEALSWVLTDTANRVYVEQCAITPATIGLPAGDAWSVTKSRLRGGLSDGVDVVDINNGHLSFTVLLSRGMGLWKGVCGDCTIGWDSPARGPVNPMFINLLEQGGLGWLKGFDECIVRCGLNSNGAAGIDRVRDNNGNLSEVMLNLHGYIANLPAKYVELKIIPGKRPKIVLVGVVEEARCFCPQYRLTTTYTTEIGSSRVDIRDEVENFADSPTEFQMLYHCNFGPPFLDGGARLVSPSLEVAPRDPRAAEDIKTWNIYKAPEPGYVEQGNYHDFAAAADGSTLSMIRNRRGTRGVTMRWNKKQLPCFCQWKHTAGPSEGYVTGMEPATNYPNLKTFERERGRVLTLDAGQRYVIDLAMEIQETPEQVAAIEAEVAALMKQKKTIVHPQPIAKWSPCAQDA